MDTPPSSSSAERRSTVDERNSVHVISESIQSPTLDLIHRNFVAVIIPARNESEQILSTLESLKNQTRIPDMITVVANNCTDHGRTAGLARAVEGVTVYEMDENPFLKAGALNYGLAKLMAGGTIPEYVVTIDADTILAPDFIRNSVHVLACQPRIGAVSAVCDGKKNLGKTWFEKGLACAQRVEYARASFTRIRTNIHTLSGAGTMIRAEAILEVLADRQVLFLESRDNLVEDFEMTLELKRHGWKCVNNYYCRADTDLMLTIPALMKQRYRWVHGTINELRRRGWQRETRASILTMWFTVPSMILFYLWPLLLAYHILYETVAFHDFWFIGLVMVFQAVSVHSLGWKMMLLSGLIVPDFLFGIIRSVWVTRSFLHSYADPLFVLHRKQKTHLTWQEG